MLKLLTLFTLFIFSTTTLACGRTELVYRILKSCKVEIVLMSCLYGQLGENREEEEARWKEYLQSTAKTKADKRRGVKKNTRRIFRSGEEDAIYCELDKDQKITKAYTLPLRWSDSKKKWVDKPREHIPVTSGQLPKEELHRSILISTH